MKPCSFCDDLSEWKEIDAETNTKHKYKYLDEDPYDELEMGKLEAYINVLNWMDNYIPKDPKRPRTSDEIAKDIGILLDELQEAAAREATEK